MDIKKLQQITGGSRAMVYKHFYGLRGRDLVNALVDHSEKLRAQAGHLLAIADNCEQYAELLHDMAGDNGYSGRGIEV